VPQLPFPAPVAAQRRPVEAAAQRLRAGLIPEPMARLRIIPRLDIKGPNLIKGIRLEGLRVVGDPHEFALRYYEQGADELVFMDIVASLYQRNNLTDIIARAANRVFIPITVGGGIRSIDDVNTLLRSGADKVAINTAAIARPELIAQVSRRYGAQCMVLSVEAKQTGPGRWEAYTDNGREHTGLDAVEWIEKAVALGAGEVLLTSVDREGTRKGLDLELLRAVTARVEVPVITSGGFGPPEDLERAAAAGASGVAVADALHWKRSTVRELKQFADAAGVEVRL
jgi:cyclase